MKSVSASTNESFVILFRIAIQNQNVLFIYSLLFIHVIFIINYIYLI